MTITLMAWTLEGTVQVSVIPTHVELTPGQARTFARHLKRVATRAEQHNELLARVAAKVVDLDWTQEANHGMSEPTTTTPLVTTTVDAEQSRIPRPAGD